MNDNEQEQTEPAEETKQQPPTGNLIKIIEGEIISIGGSVIPEIEIIGDGDESMSISFYPGEDNDRAHSIVKALGAMGLLYERVNVWLEIAEQ